MAPALVSAVTMVVTLVAMGALVQSVAGACGDEFYSSDSGLCCQLCPAGSFLQSDCTTQRGESTCTACPVGYFTDIPNYYPKCMRCEHCQSDEEEVRPCSANMDRVCQCKPGHHKPAGSHFCIPDPLPSSTAAPPDSGGETAGIVIGVLLLTAVAAAVVAAAFLYKKTGKWPWQLFQSMNTHKENPDQKDPTEGHPLTSEPESEPGPPAGGERPDFTQPGPPAGEERPDFTQPGPPAGRERPDSTQPGPPAGEDRPDSTQPGPPAGRERPDSTQPGPPAGEERPDSTQSGPPAGEERPDITQPGPPAATKLPARMQDQALARLKDEVKRRGKACVFIRQQRVKLQNYISYDPEIFLDYLDSKKIITRDVYRKAKEQGSNTISFVLNNCIDGGEEVCQKVLDVLMMGEVQEHYPHLKEWLAALE